MAHLRFNYDGAPLASLHSKTRRVEQTVDGKPFGYTEPLDQDNPWRARFRQAAAARRFLLADMNAKQGAANKANATIGAAQRRSLARRGARQST